MGTNVTNEGGISRRSFLGGVAGVGALAAMGLAGCSPKAAGTTGAESASSSASAATGVADNNAVAVDDGSAAITVDWLGAPPEIGDITETKDTDLLIVGAGNGGMIAGAYASDQKMDFILCEKGTEVGATRHWFNAVDTKPFTDQGYHTDRARLHGEWARYSSGTLLTTIDGIRINADCQALNTDFEPIEGLYCAGDCSGSLFSGNYPDQMHGVACGRTMTEALHVVKLVAAK